MSLLCTLCLVGHFPALLWPLGPDESGYLTIARTWSPEPSSVYGPHFVDRSPVSIAFYWLTGGLDETGRLAGLVVAVLATVAVVATYAIAKELTRRRLGALSAAAVAAFWWAFPPFDAWQAKGESWAVPLMVVAVLAVLRGAAQTAPRRAVPLYSVAGALAATAALAKQNLVDAVVFGVIVLVLPPGADAPPRRSLAGFLGGALVPVAGTLLWSWSAGVDLSALVYQTVGFRVDAGAELARVPDADLAERRADLVEMGLSSGMLAALVVGAAACLGFAHASRPLRIALLGAGTTCLAGIVLGGSFWSAYLLPAIPWLAFGVALAAVSRPRMLRAAAVLVVAWAGASSVHHWFGYADATLSGRTRPEAWNVGTAVGRSAREGDTILVLYGRPDIVRASGLRPPYEQLWSLPTRTLGALQD